MKTLYIDCGMGAAGDMLTAALLDTLSESEKNTFVEKMNSIGIDGVNFSVSPSTKCGIVGSHVSVTINGEEEHSHDVANIHGHDDHDHSNDHHHDDHDYSHDHHHDGHDHSHEDNHDDHEHSHEHHHGEHFHATLSSIHSDIEKLNVSEKVKNDIKNVYGILAEAESHAHGVAVSEIHFHEVGNKDAIADIAAVCMLMDMLNPGKVVASPVHVGAGLVRCAHGILPVPAPATAYILKGIPIYTGEIKVELCTPTGAALLKYFVDEFTTMPVMSSSAIGYGMGKKDLPVANCVRVMVGETEDLEDSILELSFNVDDMTPEEIGFAIDVLLSQGARDVFVVPATMKKCRPGHVINVICTPDDKVKMVGLIMKHTSTLGIRETKCSRNIMRRSIETVETPYGKVRKKVSEGYGVTREKYEYDDLAKIASEHGLSLHELKNMLSE